MGEQDRPAIADPVMEIELPLCRLGREIGCFVVDAQRHRCSLLVPEFVRPHRRGSAKNPPPRRSDTCRNCDRFYDAVVLAMLQAGEPSLTRADTAASTATRRPSA